MNFWRVMQVVVGLGLLIFVHELGHFLAAKWAGVRVEVFSLGFGPFLFSYKKGDTLYAFSLIPLGGYVRMTGQSDTGTVKEEEKTISHSYLAKSPAKRAVIIFAGVTMNVIFAFLLFAFAYMAGISDVPSLVGEVLPGSPAQEAGLAPGDRILSVNGAAVTRMSDVQLEVATLGTGRAFPVMVKRADGTIATLDMHPRKNDRGFAAIGIAFPFERVRVGITLKPGLNVFSVMEDTPAAKVGLKKGDYIETVDGRAFEGLFGFKRALRAADGGEVTFGIRRGKDREHLEIRLVPMATDVPLVGRDYHAGINPSGRIVDHVLEGASAAVKGLQPGDILLRAFVQPDGKSVKLLWHKPSEDATKPRKAVVPILADGPEIRSDSVYQEIIVGGFFASLRYSGREGIASVRRTFNTLFSLIKGDVPAKEMTSIIGIAVVTYYSTERGMGFYLWLVAFISINLAVINLVPMMPLDGGLLVFLLYEAIRGKQANQRVQEAAQIVGMVLILALVLFVLKNDVVRFWF